ncbi:MAG: hypothetical protein KF692_01920 [Cryobacterium sp.]|nr:hypothetical protein [Cryobacterium sp.]
MKINLERFDEPRARMGTIAADAVRNVLGSTDLEFWEVFLRETVQNSWDQRRDDRPSIGFQVDGIILDDHQREALRQTCFHEESGIPDLDAFRERLQEGQGAKPITMITVTDTDTVGLAGTTDASVAIPPDAVRNYRDFVLNIGRDSERAIGGGTYGFGKAVLYDASDLHMCIIYSQFEESGEIRSRLVATRLGDPFAKDDQTIFTGRQWWGLGVQSDKIEPVEGEQAKDIAKSLGLPALDDNQTGTCVAVLDPSRVTEEGDEDGHELEEGFIDRANVKRIIYALRNAAIKWTWPHMIDGPRGPNIRFRFGVNGEALVLEDIEAHDVYRHYVRAYKAAESGLKAEQDVDDWPVSQKAIRSLNPARYLGQLGMTTTRRPDVDGDYPFSHVALMRLPRLIVKYLPVARPSDDSMRVGAFIAANEMDEVFAHAEPAAHNDWSENRVASSGFGQVNFVRIALRRIGEAFEPVASTSVSSSATEIAPSGLAHLARYLGSAIGGVGPGGEIRGRRPGDKPPGGAPKIMRATLARTVVLGWDDDGTYADFAFELRGPATQNGAPRLVAVAGFVRESGITERGDDRPTVMGWVSDGTLIVEGASVDLADLQGDSLSVRVRQYEGRATTVSLSIKDEAGVTVS